MQWLINTPRKFCTWLTYAVGFLSSILGFAANSDQLISQDFQETHPQNWTAPADHGSDFTWWLPDQFDALVVPVAGGVLVESKNTKLVQWLKQGSPWAFSELPIFGVRYGGRMIVVIVPWPQYATLVVKDRIGVRFSFPHDRENATPCNIVTLARGPDPMEVAEAFREWRKLASDTGAIPKPCSLIQKAATLPSVKRLFGAPQFYLWGPALFCRHDVDRSRWPAFARTLRESRTETFPGKLISHFTAEQKAALQALSEVEFASDFQTRQVAQAINSALTDRGLSGLPSTASAALIAEANTSAFAEAMPGWLHTRETWGDGFSRPLIKALHDAGIEHALLLLNDYLGTTPRPDVAREAQAYGYLLGPYDSYDAVHDPHASDDDTWETAQFGEEAYRTGRILNSDGSGRLGFRGRGFAFSALSAEPYMHARVQNALDQTSFSAWFVDCDATGECFDDYNPLHPFSRVDDINARRRRLRWLFADKHLVVGSEGGSVLLADILSFGHGVQTPYIGHLAPEFSDPKNPSFLGKYWPADQPDLFFKSIPAPARLVTPYFDPTVCIPLYRAAVGDELIATHHWCFDSMKFSDLSVQRELLELLYMVPPLYHLNRETWSNRRPQIIRHYEFWSPLHAELATAPLTRFEWLDASRLLQRTTFLAPQGDVTITVNFCNNTIHGYPPFSATVDGGLPIKTKIYFALPPKQ